MDSLKVTDQAAQEVAVAPRVRLADIEAAIMRRHDFLAGDAIECVNAAEATGDDPAPLPEGAPEFLLSLCVLTMKNGFVVIGKSAPASPANFDPDLGKKFAYEDAVRQLWPLMGFSLRDQLAGTAMRPAA